MNLLFSKRTLLAVLIMCCSFSFAQKKIDIKYYVNNTQQSIGEVKILLVTRTDTISPKIEEGKIQISRKMEENFSLFAQIDGRTIKIGSYRPAMFNTLDAIVVGRITDFSVIKRYWEAKDAFLIDKVYVVVIPDSDNILDVIYCTVKKDVNVSLHSNFTSYAPSFTFAYEVIQKK